MAWKPVGNNSHLMLTVRGQTWDSLITSYPSSVQEGLLSRLQPGFLLSQLLFFYPLKVYSALIQTPFLLGAVMGCSALIRQSKDQHLHPTAYPTGSSYTQAMLEQSPINSLTAYLWPKIRYLNAISFSYRRLCTKEQHNMEQIQILKPCKLSRNTAAILQAELSVLVS